MSPRSKYPSRKVLMPASVIAAAAAVVTGLGITSIAAGEVANNTSIQNNNNVVRISTSQPSSSSSSDNASDYFVLQSQQELFNAVNTGQAEEAFAKIGKAGRG